jgi:hypothetical protein
MDLQNALHQPIEVLLKEMELENQIRQALDDTQIYFDYNIINLNETQQNPTLKLDLITINSEHNHKFLFHSLTGISKISLLHEMTNYIKEYKRNRDNYEIEWLNNNLNEKMQKSWFRGNDIFDVLNKFYYNKDKSQLKIFRIQLMPMS